MAARKETDLYQDVAIKLLNLRKEKKLSQAELGGALEMSPASIGSYERGTRVPSLSALLKYADYFHTTTDFILGRTKERRDIKDVMESVDLNNLEAYERIIYKDVNITKNNLHALEELIGNCITIAYTINKDTK